MRKIKLNITKKDINRAKKLCDLTDNHCEYCPIALVLKRTTRKKVSVNNSDTICINGRDYEVVGSTRTQVIRFIKRFDFDFKAKPQKITLHLKTPYEGEQ